jgi:hypothetical protein
MRPCPTVISRQVCTNSGNMYTYEFRSCFCSDKHVVLISLGGLICLLLVPFAFSEAPRNVVLSYWSGSKTSLCDIALRNVFFDCLQAVFAREAFCLKRLKFLLKTLLALKQHGYISLQQVELALQIDPAAHNQRGQKYQLYQDRKICRFIKTP